MKKVKAYFIDLYESLLPQAHSYKHFEKQSFFYSLKYFFILLVVLNTIFVLSIIVRLNPTKVNNLFTSLRISLNQYPKNLTITVKKGNLMTNLNRPYFLWMDYEDKKFLLAVVDETALPQKINQYKSSILLTSRNIAVRNIYNDQQPTVVALSRLNDQRIDASTIKVIIGYVDKVGKAFLVFFWAVIITLILILPLLSFLTNLVHLIVASLIVLFGFRIFFAKKIHTHLHFMKVLQLSFHAVTLPLILDYSLTMIHLKDKPSPLLFFFLVLVFVFVAVYETYHAGSRLKTVNHK